MTEHGHAALVLDADCMASEMSRKTRAACLPALGGVGLVGRRISGLQGQGMLMLNPKNWPHGDLIVASLINVAHWVLFRCQSQAQGGSRSKGPLRPFLFELEIIIE